MPYATTLTRTYIDTRNFTPNSPEPLPLLNTLPPDAQTSITRFLRAPDRLMSLSSTLLKYHFIHRTAKLPWPAITIQTTPKPHKRPYWSPPTSWTCPWANDGSLEFNVSHQAGMTCLLGSRTPSPDVDLAPLDPSALSAPPSQGGFGDDPPPRLGVDIACTNEHGRTPQDISNVADLAAWIDVFAEMFSAHELAEMKGPLPRPIQQPQSTSNPASAPAAETEAKLRRFYTCWALKEAFIKLVGEGLLAPWLREVEFVNVRPPAPIAPAQSISEEAKWTPPSSAVRDFQTLFQNQAIHADDVSMEVVAFEDAFLVAVATRGVVEDGDEKSKGRWLKVDIDRDIRPCAEGRCSCLG